MQNAGSGATPPLGDFSRTVVLLPATLAIVDVRPVLSPVLCRPGRTVTRIGLTRGREENGERGSRKKSQSAAKLSPPPRGDLRCVHVYKSMFAGFYALWIPQICSGLGPRTKSV